MTRARYPRLDPPDFTSAEIAFFRTLDTPSKVQDYLDGLASNTEPEGDTCFSPLRAVRERRAHCIEAAMLAAFIFRMHGMKPLLLDLTASADDQDHVIAPFRVEGCWGAVAKTNHACLGYRDPVYRTPRELVMSYFHEYLNKEGIKSLRSYTLPVSIARFDRKGWATSQGDVWYVPQFLVKLPHRRLLTKAQERALKHADPFLRDVSNIQRQRNDPTSPVLVRP